LKRPCGIPSPFFFEHELAQHRCGRLPRAGPRRCRRGGQRLLRRRPRERRAGPDGRGRRGAPLSLPHGGVIREGTARSRGPSPAARAGDRNGRGAGPLRRGLLRRKDIPTARGPPVLWKGRRDRASRGRRRAGQMQPAAPRQPWAPGVTRRSTRPGTSARARTFWPSELPSCADCAMPFVASRSGHQT
jgi:hypothetical protein